ncbi:MAG: phosphodiester glycosidase family protein [Isosphaeraceae bacterium]|nr:phosphodiester glycosidase family protein [Isosphaeraceae bacterium]
MLASISIVLLIAESAVAQTTTAPEPVAIDRADEAAIAHAWRPVFQGIDRIDLAAETPRKLRGNALRIDTRAPGIRFFVAPSNGDAPRECDSIKTSRFLEAHRLEAAINSAPFSPVLDAEGKPQDVIGVAVSDGELVSPPEEKFAAILITADNRIRIVPQKKELDLSDVKNACGGFDLLLVEGRVVGKPGVLHPRSAAGIDKTGRYLYLLAIDGRQKDFSLGTSLEETALWIRKLGAWDALNLDGGGSSSLVTADPSGKAAQVNRPIHKGIPGTERPCPNHLGIHAEPLPARP